MKTIDWQQHAAEYALSGHAIFGCSILPRIMRCPGSVRLCIENNRRSIATEYAREGSNAHALAKRAFEYDREVKLFLDHEFGYADNGVGYSFVPDSEMVNAIQNYVDWCKELPGDHFVETVINLEKLMEFPHQFGTCDHAAIYHDTLVITDLKYGQGEIVFAKENEQLLGYAAGMFDEWAWMYDIQKIVIRIAQPRLNHWDVWDCDKQYLIDFGGKMAEAVTFAMSDNPPLWAGEKQCRWCPMSGHCEVQRAAVHAAVAGDFDAFDNPQDYKDSLTPEQIGEALKHRGVIKDYLKALDTQAFNLINTGNSIPGWKLVAGRSNRTWRDEAVTERWLRAHKIKVGDMYDKKLLGPAPIEKLFKNADEETQTELKALWRKPPGSPQLVDEGDPRPAMQTVSDELDDFDDDDGLGTVAATADDGLEVVNDGL